MDQDLQIDKKLELNVRKTISVYGYSLEKLIGAGAYAYVYSASRRENGEKVAVKIPRSGQSFSDGHKKEINFLKKKDLAIDFLAEGINFVPIDSGKRTVIIMPLYSTNLFDLVKTDVPSAPSKILHPHHVQSIAYQVLQALDALHRMGYIHADIKPENVLLRRRCNEVLNENGELCLSNDQIVLADFNTLEQDKASNRHTVQTVNYRAPEVLLRLKWDSKIDIWSIGCMLIELRSGSALFYPEETSEESNDDGRMTPAEEKKVLAHLASIELALEDFVPQSMIITSDLECCNNSEETRDAIEAMKREFERGPFGPESAIVTYPPTFDLKEEVVEFGLYLLEIVPEYRPTAAEAVATPFILRGKELYERLNH